MCDDAWRPAGSTPAPVDRLADNLMSLDNNMTALRQATDRIAHRGPDGGAVAAGKLRSDRRWAQGHRRLAIVDPRPEADQPFERTLAGRKINVVANGEIYNHKMVYERLKADHGWEVPLDSGSDCEVIAHAYAVLGPEGCAKSLDGMFSFVLFEEDSDAGSAAAFAARDPVGIKPLYMGHTHTEEGAAYAFASELKALVGNVDPSTVCEIPAGHYWTPETGLVKFHDPEWLREDGTHAPWAAVPSQEPSDADGAEAPAPPPNAPPPTAVALALPGAPQIRSPDR